MISPCALLPNSSKFTTGINRAGGQPYKRAVKPARCPLSPSHLRDRIPKPSSRKSESRNPTSTATDTPFATDPITAQDPPGEFEWGKNWWPVQVASNLDETRPNRIQLLGRWFVAWKGPSGEWSVMEDMCPHRLAPLSEGRVESDGTLMCAYHAWRFDENGKCVKIPHADDEAAHCTACNSPRSRVAKYPSKVYGDLLWLWPDASPTALEDSSNAPIPMPDYVAETIESHTKHGEVAYTRILPYSYDILVENLCDPAHVPVSHHGIAPILNRYNARPLKMKPEEPLKTSDRGKVVGSYAYNSIFGHDGAAHIEFLKPCLNIYSDKGMKTYLYSVPLGPNASRLFVVNGVEKGDKPMPRLPIPWLFHSFQNAVSDGDGVLLVIQQKHLQALSTSLPDGNSNPTPKSTALKYYGRDGKGKGKGKGNPQSTAVKYYLPTSSDSLVAAFRKWYGGEGKGGPQYPGGKESNPVDLSRKQLLDRYNQHTKDCVTCSKALRMFERIVSVCKMLIPVLFMVSCGMVGSVGFKTVMTQPKTGLPVLGVVVVMALCFLVKKFAESQRQSFIFVDWVHAEHD